MVWTFLTDSVRQYRTMRDLHPFLRVKIVIEGDARTVLDDTLRPWSGASQRVVHLKARVKALQGSWREDYILPAIREKNPAPTLYALEGLLRQGRISKQDAAAARIIIEKLAHASGGALPYWDIFGTED